jgi:hypothetical protein
MKSGKLKSHSSSRRARGENPKRSDNPNREYGEGNYKASREYNEATRQFVESGRVDEAARDAQPRNPEEREELRRAEKAGRRRSKGEDPALHRGSHKSADVD